VQGTALDGVVRDDRRDKRQNANLGTFLIEPFGNDGTMLLLLLLVMVLVVVVVH
jgi:hypothetical protein